MISPIGEEVLINDKLTEELGIILIATGSGARAKLVGFHVSFSPPVAKGVFHGSLRLFTL